MGFGALPPDPRWTQPIAAAVVFASTLIVTGCMTVRIEAADGHVMVIRHAGLLRVELPPDRASVVGSISGVGLAATPMGFSVGYTRQRWAAIGPDCRAILWLDSTAQDPALHLAQQLAGVCIKAKAENTTTH